MRRSVPWGLLAGMALAFSPVLAVAQGPKFPASSTPAASPDFPIAFGGPFSLLDHRGQPVTDKDFRGRFMLIFFGYTYCPDICPTGLQTLSRALDLLGEGAERVQPLFISVDPERDRPETLKSYVGHFHPNLVGLTGSEKQVRDAARAYRVHRSKVMVADAPKDEYLVNHTSITYLMGPDGKFVTLFPHGTEADFMAKALKRYLAGTGQS